MTPHPSPHNRVQNKLVKISIHLEFFNCSLFKEYYKPTGIRVDLIELESVGMNTP